MKILAIWERDEAHKRYGSVFCLLDNGTFKTLSHNTIYDGTFPNGETRYIETGDPDWQNAFDDNKDWNIQKANYYIIHFGGRLVWRDKKGGVK